MFQKGDRIKVTTGPWAGKIGTIAKITGNRFKISGMTPKGLALVLAGHIEAVPEQARPVYDFDRTGLGIGGLGRHDPLGEMTELVARGEVKLVERERIGPMPHGQLWEPCFCGTEPVCVNCFKCERHCTC